MFPIAPPPPSGNVFPKAPSKEKQALLARQVAEEMKEDGIDAVYVDSMPRGAIPSSSRVDPEHARFSRKDHARLNAEQASLWAINSPQGLRYFTPRHYVSPSKVPGQVLISRIPGAGSKQINASVLEEAEKP